MAKIETPPPTFRIKLLHERKSSAHRKIDGMSRMRYIFLYDEKLKHYAYTPKTEAEAADIFATVGRTSMSAFAPVSIGLTAMTEPAKPDVAPPAITPPDVTAIEECIIRGIIITEDDSAEVVERLLKVARKADADGEQRGVSKAAEEVAQLRAQLDQFQNKASYDEEKNAHPAALTPAQKRAATLAAKKAASPDAT